jgi:hypothetical protein
MQVSDQRHTPTVLPRETDPVPIVLEARWAQGRPGRVRKISPPTGIRSPDRPARRYTDHAIPTHTHYVKRRKLL